MQSAKFLCAIVLLYFSFASHGQKESVLFFKSGEYKPSQTITPLKDSKELINNSYYRLITFHSIPNSVERAELNRRGIELLNYIPKNAFFARIDAQTNLNDLGKYGVSSIEPILTRFKLSKELYTEEYPHWTLFGDDQIELNVIYFEGLNLNYVDDVLAKYNAVRLHSNSSNTVHIRVLKRHLAQLYQTTGFSYFESIAAPAEPENYSGRLNHRSNTLATSYSTGNQYDGTGVTIMMQDDGYIGDHIDYQGRIDQSFCSNCSGNPSNDHGDHVAGTIMGAGNLNPKNKGMAFGADLLVFNSWDVNYDNVPTLYANEDVVITSKSYSAGCNNGYDSRARQLDEQMYDMPDLIHVFSAGNSGTSDCGYGAGAGWGNITGGHKTGKNVVTVGNLNAVDFINNSSSRGPSEDGRIKPDICGVGTSVVSTVPGHNYESKTGTSMSCPGVAGTIAQIYHAYKDANGGQNPNAGLVKAAILNTGEDLGNPGPDFKYGWGRINARKAHELIAQNNYLEGSIAQGASNTHSITVPSGVVKLKVMVYWTDFKGSTNASLALVNDIDMQLIDPGLVAHNPWVLDHTPDATLLNSDAVQGADHMNNMEQVTIDNPLAGNYTINISGFAIPEGPQEYFVVYEFEGEEITLTYPIGGEGLSPGQSERITWDAAAGNDDFSLEYSDDNGGTWNAIGTAPANKRYMTWLIPNTLTGEALVRISRGAQSDMSDHVFSIIKTPINLEVAWACPDSLSLTWDAVPGATSYEVYMLGNKYMDSIATVTTNQATIPVLSTEENWFSVRSFGPNNARSERAIAIRKIPGQFNCTWSAPFAGIATNCDSVSSAGCVQFFNNSVNTDGASSYMWYFPNGTPSTSTDENPTVCFSSTGQQHVSLVVTNSAGSDSAYFHNAVYILPAMTLPYHEGFENISTLNGQDNWFVNNPNLNTAFMITSNAALTGNQSVILLNHLQQPDNVDELISGPIDLSVLSPSDDLTVSFRYACKRKNNSSSDYLRFFIKDGCDGSWTVRKTLYGSFLSPEIQNTPFTPSSEEDWTTVHITNITSSFYTDDFRFKFNFQNGGGGNFYLDDINIYEGDPSDIIIAAGIEENNGIANTSFYPNPTSDELNIGFTLNASDKVHVITRDIRGQLVNQRSVQGAAGNNLVLLSTSSLSKGVYFVTLSSAQGEVTEKVVIK